MSNIRFSKTVLFLGFALTTAAAAPAYANDTWCLARSEAGYDTYSQVRAVANPADWTTGEPIVLLRGSAWPECQSQDAACNTEYGDLVQVVKGANGQLSLQRLRLDSDIPLRDLANVAIDPQGRFLTGYSAGVGGGLGQQVALYYQGMRHCTDSGFDHPAGAQCRFYKYEVFPVGLDESHRPNSSSAAWTHAACPTVGQQSTETGGYKPPTP